MTGNREPGDVEARLRASLNAYAEAVDEQPALAGGRSPPVPWRSPVRGWRAPALVAAAVLAVTGVSGCSPTGRAARPRPRRRRRQRCSTGTPEPRPGRVDRRPSGDRGGRGRVRGRRGRPGGGRGRPSPRPLHPLRDLRRRRRGRLVRRRSAAGRGGRTRPQGGATRTSPGRSPWRLPTRRCSATTPGTSSASGRHRTRSARRPATDRYARAAARRGTASATSGEIGERGRGHCPSSPRPVHCQVPTIRPSLTTVGRNMPLPPGTMRSANAGSSTAPRSP